MPLPTETKQPANGFIKRFTGASDDPVVEARLTNILHHLQGFYKVEIELSLNRTYRFLERLGNPHLKLPPTVHIAGTNGKGSTTATLRALLEASGHTVHVYTSPHLVHPTERIRLAGQPIASEALIDILTECIEINAGEPITFFEAFTCAAFLAFSRTPADWLILETGMGGRLDTTNVIPNPAATIITTISFDHMSFLGNAIEAIAGEKAGIIKSGAPCILGYQLAAYEAQVLDVMHKASTALSPIAPLLSFGAEWSSAPEKGGMLFRYGDDSILTRAPNLKGSHQIWNAGAALAAFRTIAPIHFSPQILSTALGQIEWPGRLQTLENHPFNALVPNGWEIIIDGGHNDSAGLVLADVMRDWVKTDPKPVHMIVAMVNRKDSAAFLRPLQPFAASITLTEIEGEAASFKKEELAQTAKELGFSNIHMAATAKQAAIDISIRNCQEKGARAIFTGSLFLIGEILKNQ